jgi:hypothetical protein
VDLLKRRAEFPGAKCALGILFLLGTAYGQINTASFAGLVKDPSGAVIPQAQVSAVQAATQLKSSAASNDQGQYAFEQLAPGEYAVTVNASGFKQTVLPHVVLHAGERAAQDFTLDVGEISQVVPVQAAVGILETDSAEIGDVIENRQVGDLPLKNRQFLDLALLSEGVVNPPGGTRGDSLQQTGRLVNIFGQRTGHNLFLVDGTSVTDEYFNNVVLNPSPDVVEEFKIYKTNYSPEFGGKSGGVINIITRSGGNQLHGTAYDYLRNNAVDARNFFAPPGLTTPFQENQFGATLGGPLVKNKTFFFLNYDGQRIRDSLSHLFSVPTQAERAGNFAGLAAITNPQTHAPFAGNAITSPLDPAAVAMLSLVPLPNLPGNSNNLLALGRQNNDNDQYNARLDHQFSSADSLHLRGSLFDARELDPFGSSVLNEALLPGFGRRLRTHSVNLMAGETHSFSANAVNELRFGWLRVSGGQGNPNAGNPFAAQYGLEGTTTNPRDIGYPQMSLSNTFTTMGDAAGFTQRIDRDFEAFDNVIVHHGNHTFEFGGYFFHLSFNPLYPNGARGIYTFNGAYTGNALADFLLGIPSQAQVGIGEGAENATTNWAHFYFQDGWQPTHNLKLELGVRYEYNQNLTAEPNQTSNINFLQGGGAEFVVAGTPSNLPPTAAALAALSPIPVVSASSIGWNQSLLTPKSLRLSPRIGLAWTVTPQTIFRAGFGIYTNQAAYSVLQNLAENVPFFLLKTVANPASAPVYTTQNILAANPTGAFGANGVNHNFAIEYNEVWNAALQRTILPGTTFEAEYVGSRTVHADSSTALNVPVTPGGARPVPSLNAFTTIRWDGWATFNALTLKVTRRFAHGLSFAGGWTWSHALDDASDAGATNAEYNLPQNPAGLNNLSAEKASSSFDHRYRLSANAVYDLPFFGKSKDWTHAAFAGWRAGGILIVQKGAPFTVNLSTAAGQDVARIGLVNGNNIERPNLVGNPNQGPQTPAEWFNTAAFSLPALNSFGSASRNDVVGPGLATLDLSLQKDVPINERLRAQFRVDMYNALNHPNFDLPGRIFGAANFGVIASAEDPREFQFALRLSF